MPLLSQPPTTEVHVLYTAAIAARVVWNNYSLCIIRDKDNVGLYM